MIYGQTFGSIFLFDGDPKNLTMTLCIAWKDCTGVHLASDSRVSFGSTGKADVATKISDATVRIFAPAAPLDGGSQLIFQRVIGIAILGNITSTFSVKDAVRILLSGLQAVPGYTDVSLQGICAS